MPCYDYICQSCGQRFEVQLAMHDKALVRCPKCRGVSERVFTAPNLQTFPIRAVRVNGEEVR